MSKVAYRCVLAVLVSVFLSSVVLAESLTMEGDIFAADYSDGTVHHYSYDGNSYKYEGVFCSRTTGLLGLAFLPNGDLAVTSSREDSVLRYDSKTGSLEGVIFDTQIDNPRGVVSGPDGTLWITALDSDTLVGVDPDTGAERYRSTISRPMAVAAGNGRIYVSSQTNGTVHQYDALTGEYFGILASGLGANPQAIGVCSDGSLLVASSASIVGMFHIDQHDGHSLGFLEGVGNEGIAVDRNGMAYAKYDGALCLIDPTSMVIVDRLIDDFQGTHGIAIYQIPEPSTLVSLGIIAVSLLGYALRRWIRTG